MLTGRDELLNLAETLTEAEAAAVLAHLRATMPELYAGDEEYFPEFSASVSPPAWLTEALNSGDGTYKP